MPKILPPVEAICIRDLEVENLKYINLTPQRREEIEHTKAVVTVASRSNEIAVR